MIFSLDFFVTVAFVLIQWRVNVLLLRLARKRTIGPGRKAAWALIVALDLILVAGFVASYSEMVSTMGLAAGPAQEHHQVARNRERKRVAMILLNQRKRHVDAGADAGRGPHIAVAHEDRIGLDGDRRKAAREQIAPAPVRRDPAAIEQAGRGEHEGAGADGDDAAGAACQAVHGVAQRGLVVAGAGALAAGDDHRVERPLGRDEFA